MFRTKVLDVSDKGNAGTVVTLEHELYEIGNSTGNEISYCTITEMPFYLGQGNWGGPRGGKPPEYNPPDRKATTMLTHEVPRTAHLLYRLNGDYNPLHADSEAAAEAGFDGVIMHGLYSWNVTCRLLMAEFTDRSATSLKEFRARFVKPVCPGDKLTIEAWVLDGASASTFPGWTEVRFQVKVNDNQLCLSHGRTLIKLRKARLPSKI
ncbi:putative peroxisomal dehydratase [Phaeomoniella chlamydospora]|uniref:Putative peroxisomal dehydratase n=1 Tax=Phaeomoniella chlamydospora TaxID=158046 RepID=A0A0G2DXU8_PHACM|nr:putative peroxisomal dehydratase [Phaeomoniella chlamydospora]